MSYARWQKEEETNLMARMTKKAEWLKWKCCLASKSEEKFQKPLNDLGGSLRVQVNVTNHFKRPAVCVLWNIPRVAEMLQNSTYLNEILF